MANLSSQRRWATDTLQTGMFELRLGYVSSPLHVFLFFAQSDFDWELSLPRWSNNLSNLDSLFSCEESADFFPTNYINAQNSFGNYSDYNSREIGTILFFNITFGFIGFVLT